MLDIAGARQFSITREAASGPDQHGELASRSATGHAAVKFPFPPVCWIGLT